MRGQARRQAWNGRAKRRASAHLGGPDHGPQQRHHALGLLQQQHLLVQGAVGAQLVVLHARAARAWAPVKLGGLQHRDTGPQLPCDDDADEGAGALGSLQLAQVWWSDGRQSWGPVLGARLVPRVDQFLLSVCFCSRATRFCSGLAWPAFAAAAPQTQNTRTHERAPRAPTPNAPAARARRPPPAQRCRVRPARAPGQTPRGRPRPPRGKSRAPTAGTCDSKTQHAQRGTRGRAKRGEVDSCGRRGGAHATAGPCGTQSHQCAVGPASCPSGARQQRPDSGTCRA